MEHVYFLRQAAKSVSDANVQMVIKESAVRTRHVSRANNLGLFFLMLRLHEKFKKLVIIKTILQFVVDA